MKKAFLAVLIILLSTITALAGRTVQMTLDNGMVVIMKENHTTPLVSSVVCVRAGSKFEDESNNGFTHFLEHLLFDGTKNMDRIQLNEGFKDHGGYINAFTQKDLTAYLFVIPLEFTEYALQTQADQLFNSNMPDEEFPKERKIVIEEIKKDNDNPDNQAEMFFDSLIYKGTPFARPVLGEKDVIANIPREKVWAYYKERYAPTT
jgi:zinc protease